LKDNSVRALLEDSNGNIWIGTDSGVCRSAFRDVKFENFSDQPGYNNIGTTWSILEDHDGNLWFGTHGWGVTKFDPGAQNDNNFTHYYATDGLANNVVRCIAEDQYGNIWFGTNQGLSKIITGYNKGPQESPVFENFTTRHGLINDNIRSILEDNNGNIWIGTEDGGVTIFGGRYFEQYSILHGLVDNIIYCINEDQHGNIWIGTDAGLSKLVMNNTLQRSTTGEISLFEQVQTSFQTITIEAFGDNSIMSILEDRNGNLWFGTIYGGVSKLVLNPHASRDEGSDFSEDHHYTIENYLPGRELPNLFVTSIIEDIVGNIWIGMFGGVTKIVFKDNEKGGNSTPHHVVFENITPENGLVNSEVLLSMRICMAISGFVQKAVYQSLPRVITRNT